MKIVMSVLLISFGMLYYLVNERRKKGYVTLMDVTGPISWLLTLLVIVITESSLRFLVLLYKLDNVELFRVKE